MTTKHILSNLDGNRLCLGKGELLSIAVPRHSAFIQAVLFGCIALNICFMININVQDSVPHPGLVIDIGCAGAGTVSCIKIQSLK